MERRFDDLAVIKRLSQVDIEYPQAFGTGTFKKVLDRLPRFCGTLGQASEANCVCVRGDFAPPWGPFQGVPSGRLTDFVFRLAVAKANIHGSGRQFGIRLNAAGVELASGKLALDLGSQGIVPNSGGDPGMLAEQRSDVGKVQRCSAEMLAARKQVP